MSMSVQFDAASRLWDVMVPGSEDGTYPTPRVIIDAPGYSVGSKLVIKEARVQFGADHIHVDRAAPQQDGRVNGEAMHEWTARWSSERGAWIVYREDDLNALIATQVLELDCHAITSEGKLHCLAEAIVDGATYRSGVYVGIAPRVLLRTLIVFDQEVKVDVMAAFASTVDLG